MTTSEQPPTQEQAVPSLFSYFDHYLFRQGKEYHYQTIKEDIVDVDGEERR